MNIDLEDLRRYLKKNDVTFDDCEDALYDVAANAYVMAARHMYGDDDIDPHGRKKTVSVRETGYVEAHAWPSPSGAWVSAWVYVKDSDAVKYRLTQESDSL